MDIFSYQGLKKNISSKHSLGWEEGAQSPLTDDGLGGFIPRRTWVLPLLLCLICLGFFVRLGWLQIVQGEYYFSLSDRNRIRERVLLAPRGQILDRYGKELTTPDTLYRLVVFPREVSLEFLPVVSKELADLFQLNAYDLEEQIKKAKVGFDPVVIVPDLTQEQRVLADTKTSELPGVFIDEVPIRKYSDNALALSHILGYTGKIGADDLAELTKQGYHRQDVVGKSGIEFQYESFLKGVNGSKRVEVDAFGSVSRDLGVILPKQGNGVQLEIDGGLQQVLYESLGKFGQKGSAVAMDPKTGAVLALVSYPGFDINKMARGIDRQLFSQWLNSPLRPLFNRALSGLYPPGSTVKPMVAAAALQEGTVTDKTIIFDGGFLSIPHRYDPSITYKFRGWKRDGLGYMDVYNAVARSSDIYFYILGGGHPDSPISGLGVDRLANYYRSFGLGSRTGIDLPGEVSGRVPDPEWKKENFLNDPVLSKWYLGDTYHLSIGQGNLLTTPLQIAVWTSALANNGEAKKPHLLKSVMDEEGRLTYSPNLETLFKVNISPQNIAIAQKTMRQTVLTGSAQTLLGLPITSAGKTGTSEFDEAGLRKTHALFMSYAPFESPEIVVSVVVEGGGEGHAVAVPVAKEALKWWAENRYKKEMQN